MDRTKKRQRRRIHDAGTIAPARARELVRRAWAAGLRPPGAEEEHIVMTAGARGDGAPDEIHEVKENTPSAAPSAGEARAPGPRAARARGDA